MERALTSSIRRSLVAACVLLASASASSAATLTLLPADTSVTLGDPVVLRVVLDAQPDVKGASLTFEWPPALLHFTQIWPGGVMTSGGEHADFVIPDAVVPADSITFDSAVLQGTGQGPGVLAFIRLQTTALGLATVECNGAEIRDSLNGVEFPQSTSSIIRILGPVSVRSTHWGALKSRFRSSPPSLPSHQR